MIGLTDDAGAIFQMPIILISPMQKNLVDPLDLTSFPKGFGNNPKLFTLSISRYSPVLEKGFSQVCMSTLNNRSFIQAMSPIIQRVKFNAMFMVRQKL